MLNGVTFRGSLWLCQSCRQLLIRQSVPKHRGFASSFSQALVEDEEELSDVEHALRKFDAARSQGKRYNEVGIQQVSHSLHSQLFPSTVPSVPDRLTDLSRRHLLQHDLLGRNEKRLDDISLQLPPLQGESLDEHFHRLGLETAEPYLSMARGFAGQDLPEKPASWLHVPGWTRYNANGTQTSVEYPEEDCLSFDTEVMYKRSPYPVMACAASSTAWYSWLSPWLLRRASHEEHLIPFGNVRPRLIVGHHVGFDRSRIKEEYDFQKTKIRFMDTLSLHVAANGMCSRQRPAWLKHKKKLETRQKILSDKNPDLQGVLEGLEEDMAPDLWLSKSSTNSLREVAKFHCDVEMDKEVRKIFDAEDRSVILENLDQTLDYCAEDTRLAHLIYRKVLPNYLQIAPHPVSFTGLLNMNSMILPVNEKWTAYLKSADAKYQELSKEVQVKLVTLAEQNLSLKDDPAVVMADPWLKQLDWTAKSVRMVKDKKSGTERLAKNQKLPGMPQWYRDLYSSADGNISVTVRSRISPLLLKMKWDDMPLFWSDKHGWVIRADSDENAEICRAKKLLEMDMSKEPILALKSDMDAVYFKVPHKDGPGNRVVTPLAKSFGAHFETGVLSSDNPLAREALQMNAMCSYWIGSNDRITKQMVVWQAQVKSLAEIKAARLEGTGIILPQTVAMGTITRRATEPTWMTAANVKSSRVGSELKSMIQSPPGYCFVGADVDSQEQWIASLMGDAQFRVHGSTAMGWMTLEGDKKSKTDLHSRTAAILNISRDYAKVFNYSRIYGAGLKHAISTLQQANPTLTDLEAKTTAERLYVATKGVKGKSKTFGKKPFWHGGTESYQFNRLEAMAEQDSPRTPVLGCGITEALLSKNLTPGGFLTSRLNWAIQSSGVDYLHLLITSMEYLIRLYNLDARLSITVHDEIRYLVAEKDKYMTAYALQVSNVWTRAMFSQQIGIDDLPQSCAFFSEVDIDQVLRKDVNSDCVTPSNLEPIPPGKSIGIVDLLELVSDEVKDRKVTEIDVSKWEYVPRRRVFEDMQMDDIKYLEAQNVKDLSQVEGSSIGTKRTPQRASRKAFV